jgi:hypothetical protein
LRGGNRLGVCLSGARADAISILNACGSDLGACNALCGDKRVVAAADECRCFYRSGSSPSRVVREQPNLLARPGVGLEAAAGSDAFFFDSSLSCAP